MNKFVERIYNGIIKENPTFIIMLGMCPTLAVTTSGNNGLYMGLTTTVVLAASNLLISALRKAIPDKVRIPAYIVVVASLVTIVQLALEAYLPVVNELLGIYIPLIVVNCIILGRAEAYAAKNPIGVSFFDGIGMGLGFTGALTIIGSFRELIGAGSIFGFKITPASFEPVTMFILAPGALLTMALLTALQNKLNYLLQPTWKVRIISAAAEIAPIAAEASVQLTVNRSTRRMK
jgi:electron transport complex protein RnfE